MMLEALRLKGGGGEEGGDQQRGFRELLSRTLCALPLAVTAKKRPDRSSSSSSTSSSSLPAAHAFALTQESCQAELVHRAAEELASRPATKGNVLVLEAKRLRANPHSSALDPNLATTTTTTTTTTSSSSSSSSSPCALFADLTSGPWAELARRVGDALMLFLLTRTTIFLPLPKGCWAQVAGPAPSALLREVALRKKHRRAAVRARGKRGGEGGKRRRRTVKEEAEGAAYAKTVEAPASREGDGDEEAEEARRAEFASFPSAAASSSLAAVAARVLLPSRARPSSWRRRRDAKGRGAAMAEAGAGAGVGAGAEPPLSSNANANAADAAAVASAPAPMSEDGEAPTMSKKKKKKKKEKKKKKKKKKGKSKKKKSKKKKKSSRSARRRAERRRLALSSLPSSSSSSSSKFDPLRSDLQRPGLFYRPAFGRRGPGLPRAHILPALAEASARAREKQRRRAGRARGVAEQQQQPIEAPSPPPRILLPASLTCARRLYSSIWGTAAQRAARAEAREASGVFPSFRSSGGDNGGGGGGGGRGSAGFCRRVTLLPSSNGTTSTQKQPLSRVLLPRPQARVRSRHVSILPHLAAFVDRARNVKVNFLLEIRCPLPFEVAEAARARKRAREASRRLREAEAAAKRRKKKKEKKASPSSVSPPPCLSSLRAAAAAAAGAAAAAASRSERSPLPPPLPHAAVAGFVWSFIKRAVPEALLGERERRRALRAAVGRLVSARKHERLPAAVASLRGSPPPPALGPRNWTKSKSSGSSGSPGSRRRRSSPPLPPSAAAAADADAAALSRWLLSAVALPLIRAHFYCTDGGGSRLAPRYYRKPVWSAAATGAVDSAVAERFVPLSGDGEGGEAAVPLSSSSSFLRSRRLGAGSLRPVPKPGAAAGIRVIANMSRPSVVRVPRESGEGGGGGGGGRRGNGGGGGGGAVAVVAGNSTTTKKKNKKRKRKRKRARPQPAASKRFPPVNLSLLAPFKALDAEARLRSGNGGASSLSCLSSSFSSAGGGGVLGATALGVPAAAAALAPALRLFRSAIRSHHESCRICLSGNEDACPSRPRPCVVAADAAATFDRVDVSEVLAAALPLLGGGCNGDGFHHHPSSSHSSSHSSSQSSTATHYDLVSHVATRRTRGVVRAVRKDFAAPRGGGSGVGSGANNNGDDALALAALVSSSSKASPFASHASLLALQPTTPAATLLSAAPAPPGMQGRRTATAASARALLEEAVRKNLLRWRRRWWVQARGVPQGGRLSGLLCCLVLARVERRYLLPLLQMQPPPTEGGGREVEVEEIDETSSSDDADADDGNDENDENDSRRPPTPPTSQPKQLPTVLVRVVDDFLLVTADRAAARRFLDRLLLGFGGEGVSVNPAKTQSWIPGGEEASPTRHESGFSKSKEKSKGKKPKRRFVRWCGLSLDVKTLEVFLSGGSGGGASASAPSPAGAEMEEASKGGSRGSKRGEKDPRLGLCRPSLADALTVPSPSLVAPAAGIAARAASHAAARLAPAAALTLDPLESEGIGSRGSGSRKATGNANAAAAASCVFSACWTSAMKALAHWRALPKTSRPPLAVALQGACDASAEAAWALVRSTASKAAAAAAKAAAASSSSSSSSAAAAADGDGEKIRPVLPRSAVRWISSRAMLDVLLKEEGKNKKEVIEIFSRRVHEGDSSEAKKKTEATATKKQRRLECRRWKREYGAVAAEARRLCEGEARL